MSDGPEVNPRQFPLCKGVELSASSGRRYRLLRRLGSGRTAEVWKAASVDEPEQEVAVKIMAPGLADNVRRQFLREYETILAISHAEEQLGLRLDGLSLVPTIEAIGDDHDPPFFAETLATGKPLDEIMREGVQLLEQDVLSIGEQLCRVFLVLHEKLKRSYLDFQPRNVFWDEQTKRITVIDWNLLSARGQADIVADLETLARLLYRLATGKAPAKHLDLPKRWQGLAAGTQAFLARALHATPSRRFDTAEAMRQELRRQLSWWGKAPDDLLDQVAGLLERVKTAEQPDNEINYQQAQWILDVAKRKGGDPSTIERLQEQIATGLSSSSALGKGQAFFAASDYQVAREVLEKARSEAMTLVEKLAAWRWLLAAEAGTQDRRTLTPHRELIARAVGALCDWTSREWTGVAPPGLADAEGMDLVRIAQATGIESLQLLAKEAEAWTELLRARESAGDDVESLKACAEGYRKAVQMADTLPYGESLLIAWGDPSGLAAEIKARVEELQRQQAVVEDLEHHFIQNAGRGIERLHRALEQEPGDQNLTQLVIDWTQTLLQRGELDRARQCLDSVVVNVNPQRIGEILDLRWEIARRQRLVNELDWAEQEISAPKEMDGSHSLPIPWPSPDQLAEEAVELLRGTRDLERGQEVETLAKWLRQRLAEVYREARWQKVIEVLEETAGWISGETEPYLRKRAWNLVLQTVRAGSVPPWYESSLMDAATRLAPNEGELKRFLASRQKRGEALMRTAKDPQPLIEQVEDKRREYKAMSDSLEDERQREQTEAQRQTARTTATPEASPQADEVFEGPGATVGSMQETKDQHIARGPAEPRSRRKRIEAHRQRAQKLAQAGLMDSLEEAAGELDKALGLCKEPGHARLREELQAEQRKYERDLESAQKKLEGIEGLCQQHEWVEARRLLSALHDSGIADKGTAGDIEAWITFDEGAWEVEQALDGWSNDPRKKETLTELSGILSRKLDPLQDKLNSERQRRLSEMYAEFKRCHEQVYPPDELRGEEERSP